MSEINQPIVDKNHNLFTDFGYYELRWVIFGTIAGFLFTPVGTGEDFMATRLQAALVNAILAGVAGVFFVMAQNGWNKKRGRLLFWINAVAIWTIAKFLWAGALLAFQ
jgi:ABC-type uncharacterized transport system permease subunit